jgi:hypothetical protein
MYRAEADRPWGEVSPADRSTSTCRPPAAILLRKELSVYMMLSGCWCGLVFAPGASVYSSTRTRSFSKTTLYSQGSVIAGWWLMIPPLVGAAKMGRLLASAAPPVEKGLMPD